MKSPRAVANFSIDLGIGLDGKRPLTESSRIAGNISVNPSLAASSSVYATGTRPFSCMHRSFTAENGRKMSSQRKFFNGGSPLWMLQSGPTGDDEAFHVGEG